MIGRFSDLDRMLSEKGLTVCQELVERLGFHGIDLGLLKEGGRAISIPGGTLAIQNLIRMG